MVSQSIFLHPEINIKAAIMSYPMIDLRDRYWSENYQKPIFGLPNVSRSYIYHLFCPCHEIGTELIQRYFDEYRSHLLLSRNI